MSKGEVVTEALAPEKAQAVAWLQGLPATGKEGFEGLVAALLESFSGYQFHLARSGSQYGRDAGTHGDSPSIALETKRYTGSLSARDLHGEIEQALQRTPKLELWVLAGTTAVSDQLRGALEQDTQNRGLSLEILDTPVGSDIPDLVHLCAAYPKVLERFQNQSSTVFPESVFAAIRGNDAHPRAISLLKERIRPSTWGFLPARGALAQKFHDSLSSSPRAARVFGQKLAPWEVPTQFIGRSAPSQGLDHWWKNWDSGPKIVALIGEEGCGKSWLAATWVDQLVQRDSGPLVVWCGSSTLDLPPFRRAFQEALVDLVTEQVIKANLPGSRDSWKRRAGRWLAAGDEARRILLVLDGLNEVADAAAWRLCLEEIREDISERHLAVAVLCTSRKAFWKRCQPRKEGDQVAPDLVELDDFTDAELRQALDNAGRPELLAQQELKELLSKPRYFGLALRHAEVMQADADYSRARLFFEDFRERAAERDGFPLTGVQFNRLLMQLAADAQGAIGLGELGGMITKHDQLALALEELQSSGVLSPVPASPGHFRVNPKRPESLWLGLGLLLLRKIVEAQAAGIEALEELLASQLEPAAESDQKANICAYALMVGFLEREVHAVSDDILVALLKVLADHQNGLEAWAHMKPWLYFSARPEVFERFTEEAWKRRSSRSREHVEYLFAEIASLRPVPAELIYLCEKWMGWVSLDRVRTLGRFKPSAEKPDFCVGQEILRAVKGGTSIRRLVWQTIAASEYECAPFVGVFKRWAVASATEAGFPDIQAVRWLLRLSKQDLGPAIRDWAKRITEDGDEILREASYWLLHAEGSQESWQLRDGLRSEKQEPDGHDGTDIEKTESVPASPIEVGRRIGRAALDPAYQINPDSAEALRSAHLTIELPDGGQTCEGDLDLEAIEPAMAAFAPAALADFWMRIIGNSLAEPKNYLNRLPIQLEDCFLLLSTELIERVSELQASIDGCEELEIKTEEALAGVLLASKHGLEDQSAFLLQRRNEFDNCDWSDLVSQGCRSFVSRLAEDLKSACGMRYRRIWWLLAHQELADVPLSADELFREVRREAGEQEPNYVAWLLEKARSPQLLETAWRRQRLGSPDLVRFFQPNRWAHPVLLKLNAEKPFRDIALKSWIAHVQEGRTELIAELTADLESYWGRSSIAGETLFSTKACVDTIRTAMEGSAGLRNAFLNAVLTRGSLLGNFDLLSACLKAFLLAGDPEKGLEAFKAVTKPDSVTIKPVDGLTGISLWKLLPFEIGNSDGALLIADYLLATATTDWDLASVTFAAEYFRRYGWLSTKIAEGLASAHPPAQARALTVLGLCACPQELDQKLLISQFNQDGWLGEVGRVAQCRVDRNEWAREWFQRFLANPQDIRSWGAFQNFLRCADLRFWIWGEREFTHFPQASLARQRQFHLCRSRLKSRIKKVEKELEKVLYGIDTPGSDLEPWRKGYSL